VTVQQRLDGYMNMLSGLGTPGLDRTVMGGLARFWTARRSLWDYGELYASDGLAQRIVDRPADDAFGRGVHIDGDDENLMRDELDRLQVDMRMADTIRWARLHGGAGILLVARDGGDWAEPLNLDHLERVDELRVYDANCIRATDQRYGDITDVENYGRLSHYTITPPGLEPFEAHETRLIPVAGDPLPAWLATGVFNIPWLGRSVLDGCADDISRYNQSLDWALRLLERKQQGVYAMQGLAEMFMRDQDAIVSKRVNLIDLIRGILNSVVIDKEDSFQVQNLSLDGIQQILEEDQIAVAAKSGIPVVVLFGKSVAGLGATQAGNMDAYSSMVGHIQRKQGRPALEKLISILWLQADLKEHIPDTWEIEFNPLWVPSELEQAQRDKEQSTADANTVTSLVTLMDRGLLRPEEVRKVIVNYVYNAFGFPDAAPSEGGDVDYAEGVDLSQFNVAAA
jgi:phage-related protein (TIGR01555 family)